MNDALIMINHITAILNKYNKQWHRVNNKKYKIRVCDKLCMQVFIEINNDCKDLKAWYLITPTMSGVLTINIFENKE